MAWLDKRKSQDGSIRWRVRDKVDGKIVTVIKNAGRWKQMAERILDDYEKKRAAGDNPAAQALAVTIDEGLEAWVRDEPKQLRTVAEYRDTIAKYKAHANITRINEMNKDNIDAWRYAMESGALRFTRDGKTFHHYQAWTIWRLMRNIKSFLRFCYRRDWVGHKLASSIRLSAPRSTKRFLTRQEAARLIKACRMERYLLRTGGRRTPPAIEERVLRISAEHPDLGYNYILPHLAEVDIILSPGAVRRIWARYGVQTSGKRSEWKGKAFVAVAKPVVSVRLHNANNGLRRIMLFGLYTGMRLGEVLAAKWEHIAPEEVLCRLPNGQVESKTVYVLYIPVAKGDKERSVAFHPTIARILGIRKRLGRRTGLLFPGWNKGKLTQARLDAAKRAGLGRVRYHDLRHSFVRNYLLSGAGTIAELRAQTGHSDLNSLQVYAHFSRQDVAQTIGRMKIQ